MAKGKKPKLIVGLVGKLCAGKGLTGDYLRTKYGFYVSSCSDRIREEIAKRGEEITREKLQEIGGLLRQEFGPQVLAERTWQDICQKGAQKAVVDSIRAIEEVEFLKNLPGFYLVGILAKPEIRFQRLKERGREADPVAWEEFTKSEERDLRQDGRDIEACLATADFRIENNGTVEEFYQKIENLLGKIQK